MAICTFDRILNSAERHLLQTPRHIWAGQNWRRPLWKSHFHGSLCCCCFSEWCFYHSNSWTGATSLSMKKIFYQWQKHTCISSGGKEKKKTEAKHVWEICIRTASAMVAMATLNRIWWYNTISFRSKFKLYQSLVTSILLYSCETWTLLADFKKKKRSRLSKPSAWENFSASPTWSTRPTTRWGARSTAIWVNRDPFW